MTIIGGQSLCLFLTLLLVPVAYYKLVEWEQSTTTVPFRERLGNLLPSWRREREI